jgi:hypothetical protein
LATRAWRPPNPVLWASWSAQWKRDLEKDPKIGRAEALRRAEMAMLDDNNPPEFAHPLSWAPFVLAGEGGPGR